MHLHYILVIDHEVSLIVIIVYTVPAVDVVFLLAVVVAIVIISVGRGGNRVTGGKVSDKVVGLPVWRRKVLASNLEDHKQIICY